MPKNTTAVLLRLCLVLFVASAEARAAIFMGLGTDPSDSRGSDAFAVSADGSTVVGRIYAGGGSEAFRWTFSGGIERLGHLPGSNGFDVAYGVSGNGSLVVGYGGGKAFEWTQATGMVALASTQSYAYSNALAVSADGSSIVGYATTSAFGPSGILGPGLATGVSADGRVIVGSTPNGEIFRWTSATGTVALGSGGASAISIDGSTIVGSRASTSDSSTAFRWTASTGVVDLGTFRGNNHSEADGASGNGSVIVGRSFAFGGGASFSQQAFIWDARDGMRNLQDVLTADGLNLTGWQLTEATAVSANGLTITGLGIDPQGENEAWVARMNSPVPELPTVVIWLCACLFAAAVARVRACTVRAT